MVGVKENKSGAKFRMAILSFVLVVIFIVILLGLNTILTFSTNFDNTSVTAQLNITNTEPHVVDVILHDASTSGNKITLTDSTNTTVWCNGTVSDNNGVPGDIAQVKAAIYDTRYNSSNSDDENYHYTNNSCFNVTYYNDSAWMYSCTFYVWYYANNGTWTCNMTATDNSNINASATDTTPPYVNELFALTVNNTLDYGGMSTAAISAAVPFNITNTGNMNINVTAEGYGVNRYDNLSMNCTIGTIPIGNERLSLFSAPTFSAMTNLTYVPAQIVNLTVVQRTAGVSYNTTYWRIETPLGIAGWCNGTIIFTATESR